MTQPTIKEKINEFRDKFFSKNPFEQEMYDKEFPKFFARLICEEMMNTNCSCRNCPETKQKSQEILKALE